ncbi:MAG: hypothetical protein ACREHD_14700, partial [Pirellulales bacterium]
MSSTAHTHPHLPRGGDGQTAAAFAEYWCDLVASFDLWCKAVDGVIVSYADVVAVTPQKIEDYFAKPLRPIDQHGDGTPIGQAHLEVPREEVRLIQDRTADIARRLGCLQRVAPHDTGCADRVAPSRIAAVHTSDGNATCAVLVPAIRYIEPDCEEALSGLERRGYAVRRVRGCSPVDHARSILATRALDDGFEETIWIDADTAFDPEEVDRLRSHRLPIVAGICSRKHPAAGLAVSTIPGTRELVMGEGGGLAEVLYAGTGFLLVHRDVYVTIQRRFDLPLCDRAAYNRSIPFFMPMLEDWGGTLSYLADDYAFSRRARLCGYKIMADTSIRLWHIGMYRYGYED